MHIPSILSADLAAYFNACGASDKCTRCGHDQWNLLEEGEMRGVGPPAITPEGRLADHRFLPLITLTCKRCASAWFIARRPVMEWIDAKREEREADAGS